MPLAPVYRLTPFDLPPHERAVAPDATEAAGRVLYCPAPTAAKELRP